MKFFRKTILIASLIITLCFWQIPKTEAAWIPGLDPAIRTGLDEIVDLIKSLLVGTLKQQAVSTLNSQIDHLAGNGAGGQGTFITNWKDYLVNEPMNKTNVYMNDYVSKMTRGRNTYSGYSTEGFNEDSRGASNYSADLNQSVRPLQLSGDTPQITYEGHPSQMFNNGNFKNMELYLSGVNNAWAFNIAYESEKNKKLEEEQRIAQAQSDAYQGFRGVPGSSPGSITSPGILAKEMMANVQNMPNNVLSSASTIPEVISALVSQMINRSITQGFSSVQRSISKNVSSVNKFNASVNKAIDTYGPAARFDN